MHKKQTILSAFLFLSAVTMSVYAAPELGIGTGISLSRPTDGNVIGGYTFFPAPVCAWLDLRPDRLAGWRFETGWNRKGWKTSASPIQLTPSGELTATGEDVEFSRLWHYLSFSPQVKLSAHSSPGRFYAVLGPKIDFLIAAKTVNAGNVTWKRRSGDLPVVAGLLAGVGGDYQFNRWRIGIAVEINRNLTPAEKGDQDALHFNVLAFRFNFAFCKPLRK